MIKDLPLPLKTVDKRVQKTRRLLLDSFVSLIIEKGYSNVTVQDIIARAGVGRSTFYSHFENKEQVLKGDGMARLLVQSNILSPSGKQHINFQRLYSHVKENQALAWELFSTEARAMIQDHVQNIMVFSIKWFLKDRLAKTGADKILLSMLVDSAAAALTSLLINWSLNGMEIPTKVMAEKSQEIVDSFFNEYITWPGIRGKANSW